VQLEKIIIFFIDTFNALMLLVRRQV